MFYVAPFQNVIFHWEFTLQLGKSKATTEKFTTGKSVNVCSGLAKITSFLITKALWNFTNIRNVKILLFSCVINRGGDMLLNNSKLLTEAKEVSEEKVQVKVWSSIITPRQQSSYRQKFLNSSMQNVTPKKQNRNWSI